MTTIRARVIKLDGSWLAVAAIADPQLVESEHRWADSHGEAMRAAHELLAWFDRRLMHEVHESRAARRAAKNDRLKAETIA